MTTRTKLPTNCTDCSTKLTRANRASVVDGADGYDDTCTTCYTYAGWENEHNDDAHDRNNIDPHCWVCQKQFEDVMDDEHVELAADESHKPRTNMSHAACKHPRNAKGRAACRKLHNK